MKITKRILEYREICTPVKKVSFRVVVKDLEKLQTKLRQTELYNKFDIFRSECKKFTKEF